MKTQTHQLSYFELRLKELLYSSFPNLLADEEFITDRADAAATAYQQAFLDGYNHIECEHIADEVLFEGLHFSPFAMVFDVVCTEFADVVPDDKLRDFAYQMFCNFYTLFEPFELNEAFEESESYKLLYTDLTGHIQMWLEDNGVQ